MITNGKSGIPNSSVTTPLTGHIICCVMGVSGFIPVGSWILTVLVWGLTEASLSEIISIPEWVKRITAINGIEIATPKAKKTYFNSLLMEKRVAIAFKKVGFICLLGRYRYYTGLGSTIDLLGTSTYNSSYVNR